MDFRSMPAIPGKANEKGRVERVIRDIGQFYQRRHLQGHRGVEQEGKSLAHRAQQQSPSHH